MWNHDISYLLHVMYAGNTFWVNGDWRHTELASTRIDGLTRCWQLATSARGVDGFLDNIGTYATTSRVGGNGTYALSS